MSALTSVRHKGSGLNRPFCTTPGCKSRHRSDSRDGGMRRVADEYLFLLGHPLGAFCRNCARDLKAAYHSAHTCNDDELQLVA